MKKQILMVLSFALIGVVTLQAQGQMPRRTVEERVKIVKEKLVDFKLDNDKSVQTDSVFSSFYRSIDKMREEMMSGGGQPDREVMREKFQKLAAERDEKLKKIFTEDQYKKWKDVIEPTLRPQRGGGGGNTGEKN